ncbi:zinc ribbon domain-containing protein [Bacillus cereus group sp. MYBK223-2]|uniref:zinc ribbon domain-containing protein n=1 Tax=Bacillus cereus group sp. MYBK223-2 TaxID=3450657 RepID=UPI003F79F1C8
MKVVQVHESVGIKSRCSKLHYPNTDVKNLNFSEWDCLSCGTHHDRDINAGMSLRNQEIRILSVRTTGFE